MILKLNNRKLAVSEDRSLLLKMRPTKMMKMITSRFCKLWTHCFDLGLEERCIPSNMLIVIR